MPDTLDIHEFLANALDQPILDVRSPSEFNQGHIPGAVNTPLFSDDERAEVGICYKQQGRSDAVLLGLQIVGPKMRAIAERVTEISAEKSRPLVHCWRGGMRSSSIAWLLEQVDLKPSLLSGGYKSFRRAALAAFAEERQLIVLSGMTGAGKTRMLHQLADHDEQTLDLEGLANHRGSSFGSLGLPPQPTCEQFENDLFMKLRDFDKDRPIWVEDESPSIGKVRVPHTFWRAMRQSPAIFIDLSRDDRAQNLTEEYGNLAMDGLEAATRRLERKLGGQRMKEILSYLACNNTYQAAHELLDYYDKTYRHAAERNPRKHVYRISGRELTPAQLIERSRETSMA